MRHEPTPSPGGRRAALVMLLAALAQGAGSGCTSGGGLTDRARRSADMDEFGSVHVSVLSVARWEDRVRELQPRFELSESEALLRVLPRTRWAYESLRDSIRAMVGGREERTDWEEEPANAAEGTPRSDGGGGSRDERGRRTPREGKPTSATLPGALADPGSYDARSYQVRDADKLADPLGRDPLLAFAAASALFQEVRLLSRQLNDAALLSGYTPYVVRLQVSLMPLARNSPYDAYCNIAFFVGDGEPGAPVLVPKGDDAKPARSAPVVIPMLSTDDVEATVRSRNAMQSRDLGVGGAFSGLTNAASSTVAEALAAEARSRQDDYRSVLGQDINALFTVARVTDNTVRVRIGAMAQSETSYAMVPRTHAVSMLVMVPTAAVTRPVRVVTRTSLIDVENGAEVAGRTQAEVDGTLRRAAEKGGIVGAPDAALHALLADVQRNDQESFRRRLADVAGPGASPPEQLWVDLVDVVVGSRYASAWFELPRPAPGGTAPELPPPQTVVAIDDCKALTASIQGGARLTSPSVYAWLVAGQTRLAPLSVEARYDGRGITFRFPSLHTLGVLKELGDRPTIELHVALSSEPEILVRHRVAVQVTGAK